MASVVASDYNTKLLHTAEAGNCNIEDYGPVALTGVLQNEEATLGKIPAGSRVEEVRVITSGTFGASTTLSLGYKPIDGATPAADATYWFNAEASTAALNQVSAGLPKTFDRDVAIVAKIGGAAVTGSPTITVVASSKFLGAK
jgi:hypothetical protein